MKKEEKGKMNKEKKDEEEIEEEEELEEVEDDESKDENQINNQDFFIVSVQLIKLFKELKQGEPDIKIIEFLKNIGLPMHFSTPEFLSLYLYLKFRKWKQSNTNLSK